MPVVHRPLAAFMAAAALLVSSACATAAVPPPVAEEAADTAAGSVVRAPLVLDGRSYTAQWYLPAGPAAGLAVLQHGFSRSCPKLLDTSRRFMDEGLMALCVNADMTGGNPKLAEALAAALVAGLTAPDGRPVPQRLVVGGHSAGGHFASRLGWALASQAPKRLAGAVMFDPVAADDSFTTNLQAISNKGRRPVLSVTANSGPCNAEHNAYPALRQVQADAQAAGRDGFVGAQLTQASTHVDAEGRNTDLLGWVFCGQGQPREANSTRLRELTATWALDMATRTRRTSHYPGGSFFDGLVDNGFAAIID
jgi:pimeloyl-ACP methyl ester carboxylesterase